MDPPRTSIKKKHKKKKNAIGPYRRPSPPRRGYEYDSADDLSFDELTFSDTCPGHGHSSEDEDEQDEATESIVKKLYHGPRKCRCCTNWTRKAPPAVVEAKVAKQSPKEAITVRYSTVKKDLEVTTPIHSVAVHSKHVKDVLSEVMKGYPGINIGEHHSQLYALKTSLNREQGAIRRIFILLFSLSFMSGSRSAMR